MTVIASSHGATLTDQNNSLKTEYHHLRAANIELLHKSEAFEYECSKLDAKNKELKTSMEQALKEIRNETFDYVNIEENDEKHATILLYPLILCSLHYLTCSNHHLLLVQHPSHQRRKRTQLKINFMPHCLSYITMFL